MTAPRTRIRVRTDRPDLWALSLVAAGLAACGGGDAPVAPAACQVDAELVAQRRDCVDDVHCPCGTSCLLGVCEATCSTDADCAGGACDAFGRCRASSGAAEPTAVAPAPIALSADYVELSAKGDQRRIRLSALEGDLGAVRVAAPAGYTVRCGSAGPATRECRIEGLARGDAVDLEVTLIDEVLEVDEGALRVFHAEDRYTVGLVPVVVEAKPLSSGRYAGFLRATHHGLDGALVPVEGGVQLPVRAELYLDGASGVIRLVEPQGRLHPSGALIGALSTNAITWPDFAALDGVAAVGADIDVVVEARSGSVSVSGAAPSLAFDLVTTFRGVSEGGLDPVVRYGVVLERVGDLEEGAVAPAIPESARAPIPGRAQQPTAWTAAVRSAFATSPSAVVASDALGALRAGGVGTLDVCQDGEVDRIVEAATHLVFAEALNVDSDEVYESAASPITRALGAAFARNGRALRGQVSVALDAAEGLIPCQIGTEPFDSGDYSVALGTIDACETIAQRFACTPERRSGDETVPLRLGFENRITTRQASVERACRPSPTWTAAGCAEMALCYVVPESGAGRDSTSAQILGADVDAADDLVCQDGLRSAGLSEARDTGALFDVLDACVRELDRARNGSAPEVTATNAEGLAQVLDSEAGCLDVARFFFALEQATMPAWSHARRVGHSQERDALTLGHRLLQEWLTLHTLVARESLELDRVRGVVQIEAELEPERTARIALDGLAVLLHPRFSAALNVEPELLAAPDYRTSRFAQEAFAAHDANVGLPVTIVEALTTEAALLDRLVTRAWRRDEPEILEVHARFLRMEAPLRAMAAAITARAREWTAETGAPEPAWIERYDASRAAYEGVLPVLVTRVRGFIDGKNPLGIDDADLPLYVFGDEASASSRLTAVSDFLLGAPGAAAAWVPSSVRSADDALEGARDAGLSLQARRFERQLSQAELDQRLDGIRRSYGDEVINLCGLPDALGPLEVLESWDGFDANSCYILRDDPACQVDTAKYEEVMSLTDVRYQFCVVNELRARTAGAVSMVNAAWDAAADLLESCDELRYGACPDGAQGPCAGCKQRIDLPPLNALHPGVPVAFDLACELELLPGCENVPISPSLFRGVRGADDLPPALLEEARRVCQPRYPGAVTTLPGPDDLPQEPRDRSCFNGALGEMALNLEAVAKDVEIARSEMADLQDAYDVAMQSCIIQQTGNDLLESTQAAHNRTMSHLRKQKATADSVAAVAEGAKDCADSVGSNPLTGGAACGAAAAEAAAKVASTQLQRQMDEAEQAHEALMMQLENQIEEEICFNDAELYLVGVRTASLRIERAAQDMNVALYEFEQAKAAGRIAYEGGRAALEVARGRFVQPAAHDFWLDESVDTFEARLRIARRLTYLAVRAVEYELQASLDLRATTLAADLPADLEAVLADLRSVAATRSIRGNRAGDLKVVLSLKKNLLQLADLSGQPDGWHRLDAEERFSRLLAHPRYAVFDDAGRYLGQQIPFDLAPLGALDLGEVSGIPVLAATDCAERVWSVNASIVGEDLYRGDAPTFTRIDLLKANTFYSQWCGASDEQPFQVASVRPERNLFREPRLAATVGDDLDQGGANAEFTRARIEAYFNVSRSDFESDAYASGATSELAARGLYGRYALFIPAQIISEGGDGDGLVLDRVDDILLRLDYVSVAR